jgi:hypothetical protein
MIFLMFWNNSTKIETYLLVNETIELDLTQGF